MTSRISRDALGAPRTGHEGGTHRRRAHAAARGPLAALVALGAFTGCAGVLGLDDFVDAGDGGSSPTGASTSNTSTATGTTTSDASVSASSGGDGGASSSSSGDGGATSSGGGDGGTGGTGGAGGAGGTGGGECDLGACPDPGECATASCDGAECGSTTDAEGSDCVRDGGADGLCDDAGACVECLEIVQCPAPDECQVAVCSGGSCRTENAADGEECDGGSCLEGVCDVLPGCLNGSIDGNETDTDCGGSCPGCENGENCNVGGDCQSGYCPGGGDCAACTTHAQCGAGRYCDFALGECRDDKPNGNACAEGDECESGNCPGDDGVCCNQPCSDSCESCGDGSCDQVPVNSDPDEECPVSECLTGVCAANGRCGAQGVGTLCGDTAECDGNSSILQDTCDGNGQCLDAGIDDCSPYACTGGCLASCVTSSDCALGFNCYDDECLTPICATPPCVLDARGYGGSLDTTATSVVVDPASADAFVVGTFSGLLATGGPTAIGLDVFLARLSSTNGAIAFANRMGGTGNQTGGQIARTTDGQYSVTGTFLTAIDLDGVAATNELVPDGMNQNAGFISRYDSNGTYLGAIQFGDAAGGYTPYPAITVNGTGLFAGGGNLGPNTLCGVATPSGGLMGIVGNVFTASTCSPGRAIRANPDTNDEGVYDIATGINTLYITGVNVDGELDFSGSLVGESNFIANIRGNLTPNWGRAVSIADPRVDAETVNGTAVVAGWFAAGANTIESPAGTFNSFTANGEDIIVAKYGTGGTASWIRHISAAGNQRAFAVRYLPGGDVVVGGYISGTVDFGSSVTLTASSALDGFVARFDGATGATEWALRVSGNGDQSVTGLATTPTGRVVAVGNYTQSATAGAFNLTNAGGVDMFVLRIATAAE